MRFSELIKSSARNCNLRSDCELQIAPEVDSIFDDSDKQLPFTPNDNFSNTRFSGVRRSDSTIHCINAKLNTLKDQHKMNDQAAAHIFEVANQIKNYDIEMRYLEQLRERLTEDIDDETKFRYNHLQ